MMRRKPRDNTKGPHQETTMAITTVSHILVRITVSLMTTLALLSLIARRAEASSESAGRGASSFRVDHETRNLIVNGDTVTSLWDYQFFVRSWPDSVRQTPDLLCGGSLIHSDMILTAAHCHGAFNYGAMLFNPYMNSMNWYHTVDKQIAHPDYFESLELINNDIMVLRLTEPISEIVPVRLNSDPDFPVPGQDVAEATGFGLIDFDAGTVSGELQVGYVSPISNSECSQRGQFVNVAITSDVMCVDPLSDDSVCGGDSGGPLTVPLVKVSEQQSGSGSVAEGGDGATAIQVGVISFGTDCQADNVPDGMARVSYFYDWIQEQICRYSRNPPVSCPSLSTEEDSLFQDATVIELDFHHDFLSEQTTFSVRELLTNKVEHVGPEYVPRRGEQVISTLQLFPGEYVFEVYDSGGDGLRNPSYIRDTYPTGQWTLSAVYANGGKLELASGDENFEYLQSTQFQVPDSQPPLDDLETDTPSANPISAPTNPPTDVPASVSSIPASEDGRTDTNISTINGGSASLGKEDEGEDGSAAATTRSWALVGTLLVVLTCIVASR